MEFPEALRLLTNLETEQRKLLGEFSICQREQRITFSYEPVPLNGLDLLFYVRHRLSIVQHVVFSRELRVLYSASNGIPRLIKIFSHIA